MKLPACAARLPWEGKGSGFYCAHPLLHAPQQVVTAEVCRTYKLCRRPLPEPLRPFRSPCAEPTGPCLHLGPQLGWQDCPTCRGSVRLKVLACLYPLHWKTSLAQHIGETSVVWPGAGCEGERQAGDFPGEAWNAAAWLELAERPAAATA